MARFNEYKLIADFNDWQETHDPDKLYCIMTEDGDILFDVYEDDFISMIDNNIVNSEGYYYLLNNPTEEQIEQYARQYGILWIDKEMESLINSIKKVIAWLPLRVGIKPFKRFIVKTQPNAWHVTITSDDVLFTNEDNVNYKVNELDAQTIIELNNIISDKDFKPFIPSDSVFNC